MTLENNIYMISISDNPISQYWKSEVIDSWKNLGYNVQHYEAITPQTLGNELIFDKKPNKKPFTETEKAVWYSHFYLWHKALHQPIIVVEHDIFLHNKIPNDYDVPINFFSHTFVPKLKQYKVLPAGAYIIKPKGAQDLIDWSLRRPINMNVDGYIMNMGLKYKSDHFGKYIVAEQLFDPSIGSTIEHLH